MKGRRQGCADDKEGRLSRYAEKILRFSLGGAIGLARTPQAKGISARATRHVIRGKGGKIWGARRI